MSITINKKVPYIRYIVRDLSFKEGTVDNKQEFENFTIDLGYTSPTIESENGVSVVIMPFKFTLKAEEAFTLTCRLDLGFELIDKLNDEDEFKQIVNNEPEYFSKYIENAINKIISGTLVNTAFNIDEVFDIPKFSYPD